MRRMNYPRFDKPTYVGTFDVEQSGFVMNTTPEPGFYFVIIKDTEDGDLLTLLFTIDKNLYSYTYWYSVLLSQLTMLSYEPHAGNLISTEGGVVVSAGSTIELYKLN